MGRDLGERHLNGIEIWTAGRQEQKPCAFFVQRLCRLGAFVNREGVEDDHVASLKRWYKSGLDAAVKQEAALGVMDNHGAVRP